MFDHTVDHEGRLGATFELALELMAAGKTDLGWMVSHRFPLEDYAQAFEALSGRDRLRVLKAVFDFSA